MRECKLQEQIDALNKSMKVVSLTTQDIANVIERWTKIPVKKITEEETQKLLNLEQNLHKRVIGQDEAVKSVSRAIRRNRAGLKTLNVHPLSYLLDQLVLVKQNLQNHLLMKCLVTKIQ